MQNGSFCWTVTLYNNHKISQKGEALPVTGNYSVTLCLGPGSIVFLPCKTYEYVVSTSQPWHDMFYHSYLYVLLVCVCPTQKNIAACPVSFLSLPHSSMSFSRALLSKYSKRTWSRVQHVSPRLPAAPTASYKDFWPLKKPESLVEGGRGKAATDGERLNYSVSVPCWPQIAGLFGSGLYPLIRLPYNKATNWWVLCGSKIKVTLTRLAAVDD